MGTCQPVAVSFLSEPIEALCQVSVKPGYWMGPDEQKEKLRKPAGGNKLAASVFLAKEIDDEEKEEVTSIKKVTGLPEALSGSPKSARTPES